MTSSQPGIIAPIPLHSRYIELGAIADTDPVSSLHYLASFSINEELVVGFGAGFLHGIGQSIDGLHPFRNQSGPGCEVPSTQADLWCWIRGDDRGQIARSARELTRTLRPTFRVKRIVEGFKYDTGRDLSGYEDGTENPEGDAALEAAFVHNKGVGLDGSSFVAVQQWVHNLDHFDSLPADTRDNIIGRRISDNEEIDDAPETAHVKRTAQENFDPEAFVVRRSMPWSDATGEGLVFVAFGKSLDAFEAQMFRMTGQEDNIVDGLFRFSHPVSGSNFWCPPVSNGKLDLSAIQV